MGIRDDFTKAIAEVRKDLSETEGYLKWALDEVERHLHINAPTPTPAPAPEPAPAVESDAEEADDDATTETPEAEEKPTARRKTAN